MMRLHWQWSLGERIGRHLEVGLHSDGAAVGGLHHQIVDVEVVVPVNNFFKKGRYLRFMTEESWKLWLQVLKVQDSVSFLSRGSFHYYYVILAFSDVFGLKLKKVCIVHVQPILLLAKNCIYKKYP